MELLIYVILLSAICRQVLNEQFRHRPRKLQPQFLDTPTNITVHRGDLAVLKCHIRNLEAKVVVWRKDPSDVPITIGTTVFKEEDQIAIEVNNISEEESQWDLVIKDIQPRHAGNYLCQVTATKLYAHYVTLHVLEEPVFKDDSLQLSGSKYVDHGERIKLICNVTGATRAPDGIDWYLNGERIVTSRNQWADRTQILKRKIGRTFVSELIVDQSTLEDMGIYVCRASDLTVSSLRVDVLSAGKPGIGPRGVPNGSDNASYSQANGASSSSISVHNQTIPINIITLIVCVYFLTTCFTRNSSNKCLDFRSVSVHTSFYYMDAAT